MPDIQTGSAWSASYPLRDSLDSLVQLVAGKGCMAHIEEDKSPADICTVAVPAGVVAGGTADIAH